MAAVSLTDQKPIFNQVMADIDPRLKFTYMASLVPNELNNVQSDTEKGHASHDDVFNWKKFPRYWLIVRGIHR